MAIVLKIITMIMIILILFIVWHYSSFNQPRPKWDAYFIWNLSDFSDIFLVPTYFPGWREAMWKLEVLSENFKEGHRQGLNPRLGVQQANHRDTIFFL